MRVVLAILLSLSMVGQFACRSKTATGSDVVAKIDNQEIAYTRFEIYLHDNVDSSDLPLEGRVLDQLFDQFLDELLLIRLALDRGLEAPSRGQTPEGGAPLGSSSVDQRQAVSYLLQRAALEPPGEAEVRDHYEANRENYTRSEGVRLEQILVPDRQTAEQAERALVAGEDFAQVAARFSQVPLAGLGGSDGRLSREDLPPAFVDEIFALQPGDVSGIVAADYGFHLFRVVERFAAREIPLSEIAHEIRGQLVGNTVAELETSFIDEARRRYDVSVYPANFPFEYRGSYADHAKQP